MLIVYCKVDAGFGAGEGSDDGGGGGFDGDGTGVGGGELEAVEEDGGAFGVDAVAGESGDEEGDGDLDRLDVFEGREVDFELIGQVLGLDSCRLGLVGAVFEQDGGCFDHVFVAAVEAGVEVAEGGETEAWGLAAASVGLDVAADSGFHFLLL